jgi:putative ubiquitin-RnfH superfamily antitoxin RatB of RatAB toxin-antitoxin module
MAEPTAIEVEVVYARAEAQTVLTVTLPQGSSVAEAITRSGILQRHPEIGVPAAVGIFGRRVPLSARPVDGDRIEIYRPLTADPKQMRKARARAKRVG